MVNTMYGVTSKYKIRKEHIRGSTRVAQASKRSRGTIEMVRPCDEGRRRTHTEVNVALLADLEFQGEG